MDEAKNRRNQIIKSSWLIIVLSAVLIGGLFFFLYQIDRSLEQRTYTILSETSDTQQAAIVTELQTQYMVLDMLAGFLASMEEPELETVLKVLHSVSASSGFTRLALADVEGNAWLDDGATINVTERDYFQTALTGRRTISDVLTSDEYGREVVVIAIPLFAAGSNNEVSGVLGGVYATADLADAVITESYRGQGYTAIVARDGSLVAAPHSADPLFKGANIFDFFANAEPYDERIANDIRADMEQGRSDTLYYGLSDEARYTTYSPLGINDWYIFCGVTEAAVTSEYAFITRNIYKLYALAIGSFMVLLAYVLINNRRQLRLVDEKSTREMTALQQIARSDSLTGLLNKKSTEEEIDDFLIMTRKRGVHALMIMDVDFFKHINDSFGHGVGDEVLVQVSERLERVFRDTDIVGRVGGDEFIVLLKDIISMEILEQKARQLCETMHNSIEVGGQQYRISASVGIALAPRDGQRFAILYDKADKALYTVKQNGRDGYMIYGEASNFIVDLEE